MNEHTYDLSTSFCGIELSNPLMPASGPLVGSPEKIVKIASLGVGGMVTKTVSTKLPDVPRPCISSKKSYLLNAELWSEHSLNQWKEEFLPEIRKSINTPLLISAGYSKDDIAVIVPELERFADAFELSTHYVGKDLGPIIETVKTARSLTTKPVFMKISPHMPDPVAFCRAVVDAGASGVVAVNSLGPAMTIDLEKRSVELGNSSGEVWVSGPALKPVALALVAKIKREVPECTIIGVGGITSAEDVLEFLLAGASAVQMLSGAMMKGLGLYKKIVDELPKALEKFGFSSIRDVVNTPLIIPGPRFTPVYPDFDHEKCVMCSMCINDCPYFALSEVDGKVVSNENKCFGCGLCESICPKGAIRFCSSVREV